MPRCNTCNRYFRREDHLRRHESSHGFPQFACKHDGCGMHFHRRDVLKRHQAVHVADPRKPRRRPRRGPLPRISGDSAPTDNGMHLPSGVSSSENGDSGVSPTSTLSPILGGGDSLTSGTSVLNMDFCAFPVDPALDVEAGRVETPAMYDLRDWGVPSPGDLNQNVSQDLGLGIGDDLAQPFAGAALQGVEDVNVPTPRDIRLLSAGQDFSLRNQVGVQLFALRRY